MKRVLPLFLSILIISCNEYSKLNYEQSVVPTIPYVHILRYHELEVDTLIAIPENIQDKIAQHLSSRLGLEKYSQLRYESIDIWSNKPIPIRQSNSLEITLLHGEDSVTNQTGIGIDSIYNYPLYSMILKLKIPEVGIDELKMQLVVDRNAEVIKDIEYPKNGFDRFIPIDTVHSVLIRKKISSNKLNILLSYDQRKDTFIWSTNTLINEGSISGSSCEPEVKHHFKIDAQSGVITEYTPANRDVYLGGIY